MPRLPAGPFPIPGVAMPTWILRYDKRGICASPLTRAALLKELAAGAYTDVIAFSHGWNNDFDAAIELYREFLQRFEGLVAAHQPGRAFKPIFVGVIWPSTWLVFDKGPQIAGVPSDEASVPGTAIDEMASELASSWSPDQVERFYALMQKESLGEQEAKELARLAAPAFSGFADDENRDGPRALTSDDVLLMLHELEQADSKGGGAPLDLDDFGGVGGAAGTVQAAGLLDKLDPRNLIRLLSVYQMKDRAGVVGARGMGPLLRDMLRATNAPIHAVGHSYGCKVQLSAICEPTPLPRPVESLLLLEPAVSHLCFADKVPGSGLPGGYRTSLDSARVHPPILCTYSAKDFPLHETFHLALRRASDLGEAKIAATGTTAGNPPSRYAALGGYGPRQAGETLVDPMPSGGAAYPPLVGNGLAPVIGLDGSNGVIGGHGDVRTEATAWALHQLAFRGAGQ